MWKLSEGFLQGGPGPIRLLAKRSGLGREVFPKCQGGFDGNLYLSL